MAKKFKGSNELKSMEIVDLRGGLGPNIRHDLSYIVLPNERYVPSTEII